jgi:hypothetical protein
MKQYIWKIALCAACFSAGGPLAHAAPLQRADVIADPAWLLHLDCDGLRPTTVGQYILSEMDKPEAKAKLLAFQSIFNFDLRNQLHGVTLYGSSGAPEDGVLMVYADFDAGRLMTLAKAASKYQSSAHNQHVIHSWLDDNKKDKNGVKPRVYAAIQGNRVIFGQREDRVGQALDVLEGVSASMAAGRAFPDLGVPGNGHFIEAAARKMNLPDSDPNAAILKLSQSVELVVGEGQQKLQGALTLGADSPQVAAQVFAIAQGLVGLMKLQSDKPDSVTIANALAITQDGSRVVGNLVLPASTVVEIMKADAARKAAAQTAK